MMQIANILPGQWQQHSIYFYSVWVHRFARAVGAEVDKLPAKPPPLPWPVYEKPVNELRAVNEVLFRKHGPPFAGKPKPSGRKYLNSYVPRVVEESAARTEVYRGEDGDNFQFRIKKCWDYPRPWSIEGVVDPGDSVYLPFFREVTIRLPLKAKVCRELKATKDGRWVGACASVKKLNAREPLLAVTRSLRETGQEIRRPSKTELRTADRPELARTTTPALARPPLLVPAGELGGAARRSANGAQLTANRTSAHGSSPAAHGSLLTAHSPGLAAYQAKQAARERPASVSHLERRLPLEGALHLEGFFPATGVMRLTPPRELERWAREREDFEEAENDVIRVMMQRPGMVHGYINGYVPAFTKQDDLDGYLVAKHEVGPDPHNYTFPDPRYRTAKWWRGYGRWGGKEKRYLTARERVARVQPAIRIVPTGERSSELIVTRRMHELNLGLAEALNLARMIEGAIKHRDPKKPQRKLSWRQELRRRLVSDPGRFIWLIRNPTDSVNLDRGKWVTEDQRVETLNLGAVAEEVLRHPPYGRRPTLTELYPEAGLPQQYLHLVDGAWLTDDLNLFEATPGGDFATRIDGFPVRLPLAVMPPAAYERWRARGGPRPPKRRRRRKRRSRNRAGCTCSLRPAPRRGPERGGAATGPLLR